MAFVQLMVAAVTLLAPAEGSTVPTQKPGQQAYLSGSRAERFLRMNNPADRNKLFAIGCTQLPLELKWSASDSPVVRLSVIPQGGERQEFTLTNRTSVYLTNLELGRKYTWSVADGQGGRAQSVFTTEAAAPRFLRAGGVGNFRDLGGWRTEDGRRVRQNMIFRSAGLRFSSKSKGGLFRQKVELGKRRVTEAGLQTLKDEFKIRTDLELRTPQETAGMETTLIPGAQWLNVSYAAYDFIDNETRGREPLRRIFRTFVKAENYPVLMHCSGGRDRTGTLAFLLNGLLGVSEEDLCRDWESTIFFDTGSSFVPDRILGLIDYLNGFPGTTLRDRIEAYFRSCGIAEADIVQFRKIMLETTTEKQS